MAYSYDRNTTAGRAYDQLVTNPAHFPKKLSRFYVQQFKKIGRGTKIEVVKSETTMTRGWDYGNYTVLKITLPNGDDLNAAITLNVASNEASGNITVDHNYGGVIGLGRGATADQALQQMLSSAVGHLRV